MNDYTFNFTQVNNIINNLPVESVEKIPLNFRNFINENSNNKLSDNCSMNFLESQYSDETLKILKVVDYYINNDNYKM